MNILLAPCGLGTIMNADKMSEHMKTGIKMTKKNVDIRDYPLLSARNPISQSIAFGGKIQTIKTLDPLGRDINANYGVVNDSVIVSLREASGLSWLSRDEKNPLQTSTLGSGLMVKDAMDKGYRKFYIFTTGSATNDGGIGFLSALGFRFLDSNHNPVELNGKGLYNIREIDITQVDKRVYNSEFIVVSNYSHLFSGVRGIAYEYGPVKGASPLMIQRLDRGLKNFALEIEKHLGIDVEKYRASGAGGGAGGGLIAFLDAKVLSYVDAFIEITELDTMIKKSDLVIVGCKELSKITKTHKGMLSVCEIAQKNHVPIVGIFKNLEEGYQDFYSRGFKGIYSMYNHPTDIGVDSGILIEKLTNSISHLLIPDED
ncbi:MAG: glycerate kinase [Gudongella sp.]|nr:glycerate kinase [Gudongella sp.]